MVVPSCTIEVFWDGSWRQAADVRCNDIAKGMQSATSLDYRSDYLDAGDYAVHRDGRAVSSRYPTTFDSYSDKTWPAFLLDIVPSGAARRFWMKRLALPLTREGSNWSLLVGGGGNPPGNVRIREAALALPRPDLEHPGFERREILERSTDFVDYAHARGVAIAGATGAGGDAPKFLFSKDSKGRWHTDEVTKRARRWFLVKFPRGLRTEDDRLVLEAEASFLRVAKRVGARVGALPTWEQDCLFVERFDRYRTTDDKVVQLGMESLCSLAGVAEFGISIPKEQLAEVVAKYTTDPQTDLREFLLRDVLDVALGNTDNHARNTAVLKEPNGNIRLSPLYDFAPMLLDPEVIVRASHWRHEENGYPIWAKVVDSLEKLKVDGVATKKWLRELAPAIGNLPAVMTEERVPPRVTDILRARIERTARMLEETK